MEDFTVDFVLDRGANARTLNFKLRHFTLVGATTMTGLLSGPRSRTKSTVKSSIAG